MSFELVGVKLIAEDGGFFGTMSKADKAVSGFGDTNEKTFKQMPGLADIAVGALHKIGEVAVSAFAAAGTAAIGFFKDSISVAGDFESGMNKFAAVAGGALDESGLKLKDFRDQFIQIGKELPVSTQEVQQAAIEMVKGGIEPATIAAGGLRQVIQFAAAADLDLEKASIIAAKALGGWVDSAASAQEKADFLTHSTDLLSKAANASTVNVDDLALGLYNVQGTAKLAGLSFDETVTALAELAPSFASSADAGTSLKSFLSRLQPTTKPAIAAMKGLGLYTDEAGSAFYDAQGKFIGMEKVSGLLQGATKDLTEAQRSQILQTIFGQDAIRVAAVLSEKGAEGYAHMTDELAKQNSVADMAKQKQAGFNTALDNFKGSAEALQITIGTVLLPVLTTLFNDYLVPGINILTDLAGALFGDTDAFARLSPAMQGVALAAETIWSSISTLIDFIEQNAMPILNALIGIVLVTVVPAFAAWAAGAIAAGAATVVAMLPILVPIAAIGAAIFVLTKAWQEDWGGIATAITDFWESTGKPIFDTLVTWLEQNIPAAISVVANFWNTVLLPALTAVWNFISTKVIPIIQVLIGTHFAALNTSVSGVATFWNNTLWPALNKVWTFIDQNIIPLLEALAKVFTAVVGLAVRGLTDKFTTEFLPGMELVSSFINDHLIPDFTNVKKGLEIVGNFIEKNISPTIERFYNETLAEWSRWFDNVARGIQIAVGWLNDLAKAINNLPSLPGEYEGHSPPPIAKWMVAIADSTGITVDAFNGLSKAISRGLDSTIDVLDISMGKMGDILTKGELPQQAKSLGQYIMEGIGDGISAAADQAVDQIKDAARRLNDAMSDAVSLGAPGSGGDFWGNNMTVAPPNNMNALNAAQTMNMPPNAALLMAAGGMSNTTNNNQRSVALNYHTTYAPPAGTSLAVANALAG